MIVPYSIFKKVIPSPVRTFLRDLDSAYHRLEREIDAKQRESDAKQQSLEEIKSAYADLKSTCVNLESAYQSLQTNYQEITNLYKILGKSHRTILKYVHQNIEVITDKPIAYDSPDHVEPWGTKYDNSVNLNFNYKLAKWISLENLTVLDLGCSGGGFVKSVIDMGCFAVGIEGSDYSKIRGRAEWSTIPGNLFTADITEPFQVVVTSKNFDNAQVKQPYQFTVITAWEFIEHISTDKLGAVFQNITAHLRKNGVVIMSVSPNEDVVNGVNLHQTVQSKEWWLAECYRHGFVHHESVLSYFDRDFIRSEPNAPNSFHLILTRINESLPLLNFDL
jgi:2-polyprenyl-3-methyl-5-hydroxy-6-metoxy-1,4-benzoquinol methylase